MAEIKLTKTELRFQQTRLNQLQKYLPTLQLKKAMLQAVVQEARIEIQQAEEGYQRARQEIEKYSALLTDKINLDIPQVLKITDLRKRYENIAGVEVPYFDSVTFAEFTYNLFATPPWIDSAITGLRALKEASLRIQVAEEKKAALEKELRSVSIRVNLFEKILIPRALRNIKKIKVFLGDMQLAAVSQAKVAKRKIEEREKMAI
ncbi:MAG: V-type ATP synthase subunit D [Parachlamydia sp.]|nr:V-type ATP synthase subunit D [Parachlamydia sp.]